LDKIYAPGCALTIYKPHLAEKIHDLLRENLGEIKRLDTCCRNHPPLRDNVQVINTCPGCDRRYRNNYTDSTTKSVWEIISEGNWFPFPDYHGARMSIHDACPTRDQVRVHKAIRILLGEMNIKVVEPERTGTSATCCGDSLYPDLLVDLVHEAMRRRGAEMPTEDVVVYCVSCVKSMFIAGRRPRYLVDLLFGEETIPQTTNTVEWHRQIDDYTLNH
jgi:Fe-S oxidoreductase